jgi:uncharacterized RDD family membrane protein YckC
VREIQERRAREAVSEELEAAPAPLEQGVVAETAAPQLGLVPPPDVPAVNPIVAAALKRLERARQPMPPMQRPRSSMSRGAAAATARVADEQYEAEADSLPTQSSLLSPVQAQPAKAEAAPQTKISEPAREHQLAVVPATAPLKVSAPPSKSQPKQVIQSQADELETPVTSQETLDEFKLEDFYDDRAPMGSRLAASLIDLLVVAFASSPFAAIIELTNGNWGDWRVMASMGGIFLVVMFLYLTAATALAGRTWGMSLVSLRPVDADTGLPLTTKQSVGRAALYILSLITLGLGIIYAIFDAEGRTVHDHLSSTAVVRD